MWLNLHGRNRLFTRSRSNLRLQRKVDVFEASLFTRYLVNANALRHKCIHSIGDLRAGDALHLHTPTAGVLNRGNCTPRQPCNPR